MTYNFDIYNLDRKFDGFNRRVREVLSVKNAEAAIEFKDQMLASGDIGKQRLLKYESGFFKPFDSLLHKPFDHAGREDLEHVVIQIQARGDWKPQTKVDFLKMLHRYYVFLNQGEVPEKIKWLHIKDVQPEPIPYEELPLWGDVTAMAAMTQWPRNRAFVMSIWEAGTRIGEHLTFRIKDYERVPHGANLRVWTSKTKLRVVFIRLSVEEIDAWLRVHPCKHDPEAPLFCEMKPPYSVMHYEYAKSLLNRLKRKAGVHKRITPHMLRHGSASYFAGFLNDPDLDYRLGWKIGSDTKSRYVHADENRVREKILHEAGIKEDKQKNIYGNYKDQEETFEEFLKEKFFKEYNDWMQRGDGK